MDKFKEKYSEILTFLVSHKFNKYISLISGDLGVILFYLHSIENENPQREIIYNKAIEQLEKYLEETIVEEALPTYANGLAGLGFLVEYIEQKGWVEIETNDILEDIDEVLYRWMMDSMNKGNYDFLHGAIGIGFYFLYRSRKEKLAKIYLENFVSCLESKGIIEDDGCMKWTFFHPVEKILYEGEYNLGVSHGIPGILSFLVKLYEENILPEKTINMIRAITKFILKTQLTNTYNHSVFPINIKEEDDTPTPSRLAWCYGDLGVCCTLWHASRVLKDLDLKERVIQIMLISSNRRNYNDSQIIDAGLCHGAAGTAHIFSRFYAWTNESVFKEAAEYWYNVTLNMGITKDGYAGYKVVHGEKYGGTLPSVNFLEGITGIGLAFHYYIFGLDPSWEELLFIR